jgi:hypothetical protein
MFKMISKKLLSGRLGSKYTTTQHISGIQEKSLLLPHTVNSLLSGMYGQLGLPVA